MVKNLKSKLVIAGLFSATLFFLGIFIFLFCNNIIEVLAVWLFGTLCSFCADMTSLYLDKFGYTSMKLGDYILLSRNNEETDIVERVIGEIISINDENYSARVGKISLKINKNTLKVTADDGKNYKFFGVVNGI